MWYGGFCLPPVYSTGIQKSYRTQTTGQCRTVPEQSVCHSLPPCKSQSSHDDGRRMWQRQGRHCTLGILHHYHLMNADSTVYLEQRTEERCSSTYACTCVCEYVCTYVHTAQQLSDQCRYPKGCLIHGTADCSTHIQWNLSIKGTIGTQLAVLYTVEPLYKGHQWDPAGCPV